MKYKKYQLNTRKNYYSKGDKIQEQVAQRVCGVSMPGGIQNPVEHSPDQPTPAHSAVNRDVKLDDLQRSIPSLTIL